MNLGEESMELVYTALYSSVGLKLYTNLKVQKDTTILKNPSYAQTLLFQKEWTQQRTPKS